jgi:transposase
MRSRQVEERRADILAVWEARKDISLKELRLALIEVGLNVSVAGLHRFFVRHGITRKKRMAHPVCKGDVGRRAGLHQRIRSQGFSPGQDGSRALRAS